MSQLNYTHTHILYPRSWRDPAISTLASAPPPHTHTEQSRAEQSRAEQGGGMTRSSCRPAPPPVPPAAASCGGRRPVMFRRHIT